MKINVLIPCAGEGKRCNLSYNKLFYDIGSFPLIVKTINAFIREDIYSITLICSEQDFSTFKKIIENINANIKLVLGGDTRQKSVHNGLLSLDKDTDFVIIHDGARPFIDQKTISLAIEQAKIYNSCVVCGKSVNSLRQITSDGSISLDRDLVVQVQTPQIFKYDSILKYYTSALEDNLSFTDDASLAQHYNEKIHLLINENNNTKITVQEDLNFFCPKNAYIGHGWDTHELVENRKLILGGVDIPHTKGLLGHSDADVLVHAIMDALLSASHNRDIGTLFPDSDPKYKGISSLLLLKEVDMIIKKQGYIIGNISAVIMAQKPKLNPYLLDIQKSIADALNIDINRITISATTTEKLGLCGKEEAISSSACCLLYKNGQEENN